ncbi:hypothetical protein [Streptomyces sp. NPDC059928]
MDIDLAFIDADSLFPLGPGKSQFTDRYLGADPALLPLPDKPR